MIAETRERLEAWVAAVAGDVTCSAAPPGADEAAEVVLYLMALEPRPEMRTMRRPEPFRFGLRYLVVAQGEGAEERLGRLLEAALDEDDLEVDLAPLDPAVWLAFGSPPRPAFVIEVEAAVPRKETEAPLVRAPLVVDVQPSRVLRGEVLGPDRIPIPGARIEVLGLNMVTHADSRGAFEFATMPPSGRAHLRISARGREFMTVADLDGGDEPFVIHCNLQEG